MHNINRYQGNTLIAEQFQILGRCIIMRQWAYLTKPYPCNDTDMAYKIMVYETEHEGVFVFLYCSKDAMQCSFDCHYTTMNDALEDWESKIDENGWHQIDNPLPYCQEDAFQPLRVKDRNEGRPQWGKFEILESGKWVDYN